MAVAPCWTALRNTSRGCAKAEVAVPEVTSTSFFSRFFRLRHKTQNFSTSKPRVNEAMWAAISSGRLSTGDPNSYGFRRARSTADAIQHCFCVLSQVDDSATWVLEGDIKGCFDNISHDWMLKNIPTDTEVLRKWLRAGYVDKRTWFATEAGTPQGGIISPTLANLTLDGLERVLKERFRPHSWRGPHATRQRHNPKVHLIRYADDFVITGISRELLQDEVLPVVERFLNERGFSSRGRPVPGGRLCPLSY